MPIGHNGALWLCGQHVVSGRRGGQGMGDCNPGWLWKQHQCVYMGCPAQCLSGLWKCWGRKNSSPEGNWIGAYNRILEVKPPRRLDNALELPRLWWTIGKFVNIRFTSERKEARDSEVRKMVERDPAWSWHLVGNSSYLNGDIEIMGGDFELRQINSQVNPLIYLLVFLLFKLLEWLIISIDSMGCMNILLYLWSIPCN
jgi:hypothetical protein